MRRVEITYRYDDKNASVRPRPSNTDEAVLRLTDGNRTFAELLNSVKEGGSPCAGLSKLTLATSVSCRAQVPLRSVHLRRFLAARTLVFLSNWSSTKD